MQPSYMIRYQFDTSAGDISTDEENILIGFSTQEKHGILMFIRSDANPYEYISIELNNNGLCASLCCDYCISSMSFCNILPVELASPSSFRQPHSVHSPPGSPHPVHITSSQSPSSLAPSITPSDFHSRLKTHLFH